MDRRLEGLHLPTQLWRRRSLQATQLDLGSAAGISFPEVADGDRSTYKDLTVLVEPQDFGPTAEAPQKDWPPRA
jgi:hypothetical protein